jgi:rRNA maturation endonuclease Nob1
MTALVAGTLLAVASLAFVLYPLFFEVAERTDDGGGDNAGAADDSPILALREIEFDRATGKLSDTDYAELKKTYSDRALQDLRGADQLREQRVADEESVPLDAIEARVRQYRRSHRACTTCGVRPEPDAVYCSTCGSFLDRACSRCKAEIREPGATFCSTCGAPLVSAPVSPAVVTRT